MRILSTLAVLATLALTVCLPGLSQSANDIPGPVKSPVADGTNKGSKEEKQKTELDLPIDESIKVTVEPLAVANLVDRVLTPCTITVRSLDALSVRVFVVPVDAPYGGYVLDKPHLIGQDIKSARSFTVRWSAPEPSRYVKLFAVVQKKAAPDMAVRSHTMDLALGGCMLDAQGQSPGNDPNN